MKSFQRFSVFLAVIVSLANVSGKQKPASKGDYFVYFGTYTGEKSKGIYAYRFQPSSGKLTDLGLAGEIASPSFLAIHPNQRFLYAVSETASFDGKKTGAVSAFSIDAQTGKLTLLNTVSSEGEGPCHLMVDGSGKALMVANYGSGSVAVYPLSPDGRLGKASAFIQHTGSSADPQRQQGPHAHCVGFSRDNRFAFAADLGLDKLMIYRFDARKGTLTANEPAFEKSNAGAGPRHFAFEPGGRFAYVINEMQSSMTALAYDARKGSFKHLGTVSTLPKDFTGKNSGAEVEVDPAGRFVYGSNRGHDSIAVFAIDSGKGTLTAVDHTPTQGKVPRGFGIDPTGAYLFAGNQNSDTVVLFRRDAQTGKLTPAGPVLKIPSPVCVKFAAAR